MQDITHEQNANTLLSHIYLGNIQHDIACDIASIITPYLLTLANRNDPISGAMPKVVKASTIVAVTCRFRRCYLLKYNANVDEP